MDYKERSARLLPCPFCGGKVQLVYHKAKPKSEDCEYKKTDECDDCYECGWHEDYWTIRHICKTRYWNHWTFDFDSGFCDTEAEAIAAWNTRTERTCHINELDALAQTLSMVNGCSWGECSECGCLTPTDSVFCIECGAKVVAE